jgi:hypothetical protein
LRFNASLDKRFTRLYLKKVQHKIGLVEWLEVYALKHHKRKKKRPLPN